MLEQVWRINFDPENIQLMWQAEDVYYYTVYSFWPMLVIYQNISKFLKLFTSVFSCRHIAPSCDGTTLICAKLFLFFI